jgi:hypothetical protein
MSYKSIESWSVWSRQSQCVCVDSSRTMKNRRTALAIALAVIIVSVLHLLSDNINNDSDGVINYYWNLNKRNRSLRQKSPYFDPKTVTRKESSPFIVPEANLADTKNAKPTVIRNRFPPEGHVGMVVDVLSIGSKTRLELVSSVCYALYAALIVFR